MEYKRFGNVGVNKKKWLGELVGFDEKEGIHGLFEEDKRWEEAKLEVERLASLEEISLRKKSRVLWLKEGVNNSKFFHRMANSCRRRHNHLGSLEVDGVVNEDELEVIDQVVRFYENLYKEIDSWTSGG